MGDVVTVDFNTVTEEQTWFIAETGLFGFSRQPSKPLHNRLDGGFIFRGLFFNAIQQFSHLIDNRGIGPHCDEKIFTRFACY
ncbi:hypothetical protein D3C85_1810600 [compost metagenome]